MKYINGRTNLACTIFVPFDCNNNCPFCTSKKMYKDIKGNPAKILEDIRLINQNPDVVEYVLTGGEPFANLEETKRIVDAMEKRCFVNTTLPLNENIDEVINFINNEEKVQGINISRHIGFNFSGVADLSIIDRINKPVRINTVINKNFSFKAFKEFVKEWGSDKRLINLRADYTKLDTTSLRARDLIENILSQEYRFCGGGGCLVCHTTSFEAENCRVQYHRGLMYSSVSYPMVDKVYVNDVIITPDGNVYKDWDFKEDKDFLKWIFRTPDITDTVFTTMIDVNGKSTKFYIAKLRDSNSVELTRSEENALVFQRHEDLEKAEKSVNEIKELTFKKEIVCQRK